MMRSVCCWLLWSDCGRLQDYNSVDSRGPGRGRFRRDAENCGPLCVTTGLHIVYRRREAGQDHSGDYRHMETDLLPYKPAQHTEHSRYSGTGAQQKLFS